MEFNGKITKTPMGLAYIPSKEPRSYVVGKQTSRVGLSMDVDYYRRLGQPKISALLVGKKYIAEAFKKELQNIYQQDELIEWDVAENASEEQLSKAHCIIFLASLCKLNSLSELQKKICSIREKRSLTGLYCFLVAIPSDKGNYGNLISPEHLSQVCKELNIYYYVYHSTDRSRRTATLREIYLDVREMKINPTNSMVTRSLRSFKRNLN